jgi:predicted dehydrogenase
MRKLEMSKTITRRAFVAGTGAAGAAMSIRLQGRVQAAVEEGKTVTLAFVGCAHIHTPGFIKLLNGRKDVKVKRVWDHDPSRAAKCAGELKAVVAAKPEEIWSDKEIVGVIICSETNRHYALVMAAAGAGKHMFVEKPLGITSKESRAMADAIENAHLIFTTGYFMRTLPINLFVKGEVEKGNFGQITRIRGSNCHNGSLGGWFDKEWRWMADPKIAGVGGFGDLGTHSLDILMWLLGDIGSVTADIKPVTRRYGDCDESGEALIQFANGVTGTLAAGWVDLANPVTLMVSGTEGFAMLLNDEVYYKSKKVDGADGKKPWVQLPPAYPLPMDMFVDAIKGRKDLPLVSPREAAARVSVMEAMYLGSREHRWVKPA